MVFIKGEILILHDIVSQYKSLLWKHDYDNPANYPIGLQIEYLPDNDLLSSFFRRYPWKRNQSIHWNESNKIYRIQEARNCDRHGSCIRQPYTGKVGVNFSTQAITH